MEDPAPAEEGEQHGSPDATGKKRTAEQQKQSAVTVAGLLIKHYPGQEQVDLSVRVQIPGSYFSGTSAGALNATERRERYDGEAVAFEENHVFQKQGQGKKAGSREFVGPGIKFLCRADAEEVDNPPMFWMELQTWNRYRNDTYKNRRADELKYIRASDRPTPEAPEAPEDVAAEPERSRVFDQFDKVGVR